MWSKKSTRSALFSVSVSPWWQLPVCINSLPFHSSFHLSISVVQTDIIHVTFYSIITLESSRIWLHCLFPLLKSPVSVREQGYFFPVLGTFRDVLTIFDIRNTSPGQRLLETHVLRILTVIDFPFGQQMTARMVVISLQGSASGNGTVFALQNMLLRWF